MTWESILIIPAAVMLAAFLRVGWGTVEAEKLDGELRLPNCAQSILERL